MSVCDNDVGILANLKRTHTILNADVLRSRNRDRLQCSKGIHAMLYGKSCINAKMLIRRDLCIADNGNLQTGSVENTGSLPALILHFYLSRAVKAGTNRNRVAGCSHLACHGNTVSHMLQRHLNAEFTGKTNGCANIVCTMRVNLQRHLALDDRNQRLHLDIIFRSFQRIASCCFFLPDIILDIVQGLTEQCGSTHSGIRLLFWPLDILTKGALHSNRVLEDHIIDAGPVCLDCNESSRQDAPAPRAGANRCHAALERFANIAVGRIERVKGTHLRTGVITGFVIIGASNIKAVIIQTSMTMGIHKTGKHLKSGRIK